MAARKAEAAPKKPKALGVKEARRRLEVVGRALADHYGPHIYPDERMGPLCQLVFAMLAGQAAVTNARKAVRELRESFADWNEVRVANAADVEEVLVQSRIPEPHTAAVAIRDLLQEVFDGFYTLDVAGLKAAQPADKVRKVLAGLKRTPPYMRQLLLLVAGFDEPPALDPATNRVLERVGALAPADPEASRRKALGAVFAGQDALRLYHVMVEHGKKLCVEAAPKCSRCPVQPHCAYGQEQVAVAKRARPKSAAAAKPERPAAKAGARRKEARKSAAAAKKKSATAARKSAAATKRTAKRSSRRSAR